jgi:hypothetical protein
MNIIPKDRIGVPEGRFELKDEVVESLIVKTKLAPLAGGHAR